MDIDLRSNIAPPIVDRGREDVARSIGRAIEEANSVFGRRPNIIY